MSYPPHEYRRIPASNQTRTAESCSGAILRHAGLPLDAVRAHTRSAPPEYVRGGVFAGGTFDPFEPAAASHADAGWQPGGAAAEADARLEGAARAVAERAPAAEWRAPSAAPPRIVAPQPVRASPLLRIRATEDVRRHFGDDVALGPRHAPWQPPARPSLGPAAGSGSRPAAAAATPVRPKSRPSSAATRTRGAVGQDARRQLRVAAIQRPATPPRGRPRSRALHVPLGRHPDRRGGRPDLLRSHSSIPERADLVRRRWHAKGEARVALGEFPAVLAVLRFAGTRGAGVLREELAREDRTRAVLLFGFQPIFLALAISLGRIDAGDGAINHGKNRLLNPPDPTQPTSQQTPASSPHRNLLVYANDAGPPDPRVGPATAHTAEDLAYWRWMSVHENPDPLGVGPAEALAATGGAARNRLNTDGPASRSEPFLPAEWRTRRGDGSGVSGNPHRGDYAEGEHVAAFLDKRARVREEEEAAARMKEDQIGAEKGGLPKTEAERRKIDAEQSKKLRKSRHDAQLAFEKQDDRAQKARHDYFLKGDAAAQKSQARRAQADKEERDRKQRNGEEKAQNPNQTGNAATTPLEQKMAEHEGRQAEIRAAEAGTPTSNVREPPPEANLGLASGCRASYSSSPDDDPGPSATKAQLAAHSTRCTDRRARRGAAYLAAQRARLNGLLEAAHRKRPAQKKGVTVPTGQRVKKKGTRARYVVGPDGDRAIPYFTEDMARRRQAAGAYHGLYGARLRQRVTNGLERLFARGTRTKLMGEDVGPALAQRLGAAMAREIAASEIQNPRLGEGDAAPAAAGSGPGIVAAAKSGTAGAEDLKSGTESAGVATEDSLAAGPSATDPPVDLFSVNPLAAEPAVSTADPEAKPKKTRQRRPAPAPSSRALRSRADKKDDGDDKQEENDQEKANKKGKGKGKGRNDPEDAPTPEAPTPGEPALAGAEATETEQEQAAQAPAPGAEDPGADGNGNDDPTKPRKPKRKVRFTLPATTATNSPVVPAPAIRPEPWASRWWNGTLPAQQRVRAQRKAFLQRIEERDKNAWNRKQKRIWQDVGKKQAMLGKEKDDKDDEDDVDIEKEQQPAAGVQTRRVTRSKDEGKGKGKDDGNDEDDLEKREREAWDENQRKLNEKMKRKREAEDEEINQKRETGEREKRQKQVNESVEKRLPPGKGKDNAKDDEDDAGDGKAGGDKTGKDKNGAAAPTRTRTAQASTQTAWALTAPQRARARLQQDFPTGGYIIPTSGQNLECGLYAIRSSMAAQYPTLPQPTLPQLRHVRDIPAIRNLMMIAAAAGATEIAGHISQSNFSADELAAFLYHWGARLPQPRRLQLAYVPVGGGAPVLIGIPDDNLGEAIVVWIYHNGNGHWEGLRRNAVTVPAVAAGPVEPEQEIEDDKEAGIQQQKKGSEPERAADEPVEDEPEAKKENQPYTRKSGTIVTEEEPRHIADKPGDDIRATKKTRQPRLKLNPPKPDNKVNVASVEGDEPTGTKRKRGPKQDEDADGDLEPAKKPRIILNVKPRQPPPEANEETVEKDKVEKRKPGKRKRDLEEAEAEAGKPETKEPEAKKHKKAVPKAQELKKPEEEIKDPKQGEPPETAPPKDENDGGPARRTRYAANRRPAAEVKPKTRKKREKKEKKEE